MQDTVGFRNPTRNKSAIATIAVGQLEIINLFGVFTNIHAPDDLASATASISNDNTSLTLSFF
jgi:hypothetical protein